VEPATYRTFVSDAAGGEYAYLLYLPPSYEKEPARRFPVVYWLHGRGGDITAGLRVVRRLDEALRQGTVPEIAIVCVNGLKCSMYCDSKGGRWPVESAIVNDLIPHIDATLRTIPRREARGVEGYSMGGFGAARLGFKYPELFGSISILSGALHDPEQ
jgi:endo-1,4-beta-xylanase